MIKAISIDKKLVDDVKNTGIKNFSKYVCDLIRDKIYVAIWKSDKK